MVSYVWTSLSIPLTNFTFFKGLSVWSVKKRFKERAQSQQWVFTLGRSWKTLHHQSGVTIKDFLVLKSRIFKARAYTKIISWNYTVVTNKAVNHRCYLSLKCYWGKWCHSVFYFTRKIHLSHSNFFTIFPSFNYNWKIYKYTIQIFNCSKNTKEHGIFKQNEPTRNKLTYERVECKCHIRWHSAQFARKKGMHSYPVLMPLNRVD